MFKDFKEFMKQKRQMAYPSSQLYMGALARYTITPINEYRIKTTKSTYHGFYFMIELSPKEKKKYFKNNYGIYPSDFPDYLRDHDNIRLFKVLTLNKIIPELAPEHLKNMDCGFVESVVNPNPITVFNKNIVLPEYITIEQMRQLEAETKNSNHQM